MAHKMLKTSYTLNLGQLLKIAHELKKYLWPELKLKFQVEQP